MKIKDESPILESIITARNLQLGSRLDDVVKSASQLNDIGSQLDSVVKSASQLNDIGSRLEDAVKSMTQHPWSQVDDTLKYITQHPFAQLQLDNIVNNQIPKIDLEPYQLAETGQWRVKIWIQRGQPDSISEEGIFDSRTFATEEEAIKNGLDLARRIIAEQVSPKP